MSVAPGSFRISGSVGRGGMNLRSDVLLVQQLINNHLPINHLPIPLRPLNVDGYCGPLTLAAIDEIQRRVLHMNRPDGRVDPNGATFRFLTGASIHLPPKPSAGSGVFPPDVIAAAQAWQ